MEQIRNSAWILETIRNSEHNTERPSEQKIKEINSVADIGNASYPAKDMNNSMMQSFDSAKLVSDLLGQETVVFETMSRAIDAEETGISFGSQHVARPLLTPDEVRTLREDLQLLFLAGQRPIVAAKLRYYADREFAGKFDKA